MSTNVATSDTWRERAAASPPFGQGEGPKQLGGIEESRGSAYKVRAEAVLPTRASALTEDPSMTDPAADAHVARQSLTIKPRTLSRPRDVPFGNALVRLMKHVQVSDGGCWIWTGSLTPGGYGQVGVGSQTDGSRRLVQAHRASYEIIVGPIPEGMQLDHLCRNRACINPNHLEPVTQQENIRRGEAGKHWKEKTHCPHGHPYDEVNTKWYKGRRFCRECNRIAVRQRDAKKRGAR